MRQAGELVVPAGGAGARQRDLGVVAPAHAAGQYAEEQDDAVLAELAHRGVLRVVGEGLRELLPGGLVPLLQQRAERPREPVRHRAYAGRRVQQRGQSLQRAAHLGTAALVGVPYGLGEPQQGQGAAQSEA